MVLARLQELIGDFYALDTEYDVSDFLITDEALVEALDRDGRASEEKLLIAESPGEAARVGLYVQRDVVERLTERDPADRLDDTNLADFWTAFEGVSHFSYFAFNAALERPVTLLEMELQAEVDKFVITALLIKRQAGKAPPRLHNWLFELPRLDRALSAEERVRYRDANRYAGKYCLRLAPWLARAPESEALRAELRRFYRLSQPAKIHHIGS